jgi:hypothetical protein
MAESISLAVLENLVHMSKVDFPVGFVTVSALIPEGLSILTDDDVKRDLSDAREAPRTEVTPTNGHPAPAVRRSAVIRGEFNFLLNPRHAEFGRIIAEPAIPLVFDERLFPPGEALQTVL